MKYNIVIDYIEASANNKTAKITITNDKGQLVMKNAPISLPSDVFDKNLGASYFSLNGSKPKVKSIDFSENNAVDDFYDSPKFSAFTDFNEENENEEKIFFDEKNKDYIIHKRNILFFPQNSESKLGIDKTAFILHSNDYNKIADILKQDDVELSFVLKKKRFALFSIFENRDQNKRSDINGAYNTLKELWQKKKLYSSNTTNLVSERLKAASKKIMSKIIKKTENENVNEVKIKEDNIVEGKEEIIKSTNTEKPKVEENNDTVKEVKKTTVENGNKFSNKGKNSLFVNSDDGMEAFINSGNNNRNLSPEFLLKFHSYFTMQKMEINENNILKSLKSIGQNDIIKGVSFISNENGFFIQMFEDDKKTKPLASIAFDYETKKMSLRNETSKILLSPSDKNKKLMTLSAEYEDIAIHGDVLNRSGDTFSNREDVSSSLVNFKISKNGVQDDTNHAVWIFNELEDVNTNDLFILKSNSVNLKGNGDIVDYLKDGIQGVYSQKNLDDLLFQGKNEEILNMKKEKPDVVITNEDLESVEPSSVIQRNPINSESENIVVEKQTDKNNENISENVVGNVVGNETIPTPTNNVSPFPPNYVRIMSDSEFDDVADRTLGVNIPKVKHQFLTNDPKLTRIDITALEYEYFFKPFKEDRIAAKKKAEEEERKQMERQLLIAFQSQPIENQIEILIHRPIEKRKEVFETETDPLVDMIYNQPLEDQIRILSKYSVEERVAAFEEGDLLDIILKKNNIKLEDVKKEEIATENNEIKQEDQTQPEVLNDTPVETINSEVNNEVEHKETIVTDLKSDSTENSNVVVETPLEPLEPPVIDEERFHEYDDHNNVAPSKWNVSEKDNNSEQGINFNINWNEDEEQFDEYKNNTQNNDVPKNDDIPPIENYNDMQGRDYSDGNIYDPQDFENCYSENAEKYVQDKNTLSNVQLEQNVPVNNENKDDKSEKKQQPKRMKP